MDSEEKKELRGLREDVKQLTNFVHQLKHLIEMKLNLTGLNQAVSDNTDATTNAAAEIADTSDQATIDAATATIAANTKVLTDAVSAANSTPPTT